MKRPNHSLLMVAVLLGVTGCADVPPVRGPAIEDVLSASRGTWQTAERLTRGAGTEYQADYHAETDRLVYVSERTDGAELYVQRRPRVPLQPAHPIASHSARDLWPRFSPDGDSVVFVSARSDSAGDLWRYDRAGWLSGLLTGWLFSGEPRRLTDDATSDDQPCWHPDGRRIVYASAEHVGASYNLWMLGPDGSRERLTEEGGQMPDCSPDGRYVVFVSRREGNNPDLWVLRLSDRRVARLTREPALDLYPCWGADGRRVFFVRCEFDTTGDGRLDLDDATSIFSVSFDETIFEAEDGLPPARQLTSYGASESFPRPMGEGFLFTRAAPAGGADIYALGPTGQVPDLRKAEAFLAFARKVDDEDDLYRRELAWRNAVWAARTFDAASQRVGAEARLGLGRVYMEMGRMEAARRELAIVLEGYPDAPLAVGRARVELLALNRHSLPGEAEEWRAHLESARGLEGEYRQLASGTVGGRDEQLRAIAAEALLEVGRSELARGRPAEALQVLESIPVRYPEEERICAEALLVTAEVYSVLGEPKALVDAYLDVLERYPGQERSATEAARRAVDVMVRPEAGFEERLSGLRQLVEDYRRVPVLPALAQNAIGDLFYSRKDYLEALEQYRHTMEEFPSDTAQTAAAHLAAAHIHVEQQDFERAADVLRDLRERHGRSGGRIAERAREGLVRSLLLKAQHEKELGDFGLAADTYATLLEVDADSVAAVRGMVEAYARLGRIEDTILDYREQVRQNSTNHRAHYALALAYSYYGPEDWVGRSGLTRRRVHIDRRATELVDRAITLEPDISYYHQLRGFLLNRRALATDKTEPKLRTLDAYLTALGLGSREDDPANYANLLFNVGEGYTLIGRPDAAFDYYRRALGAGFSLEGERGFAAVRNISRSATATGNYGMAAGLLRDFLNEMAESPDDVGAMRRRAEVLDRLALALNLDGDYRAAVERYRQYAAAVQALIEADPGSADAYRRNLLRGYRNQAVNLYLAARQAGGGDEDLEGSYELLQRAVARLHEVGVVEQEGDGGAGLVTIEVEVAVGGRKGAGEFDVAAESRLLYTYMGRISAVAGDYPQAISYLERKLGLYPGLPKDTERTDLLVEQAVVWSQIGSYRAAAGDLPAARTAYKRAADLDARAGNLEGEAAATVALGHVALAGAGSQNEPERTELMARHRRVLEAVAQADAEHLLEMEAALRTNLAALMDRGGVAPEEQG